MASSDAATMPPPSKFSLSLGSTKSSSPRNSKSQSKRLHKSSTLTLGEEEQGPDYDHVHEQISSFGKDIGNEQAQTSSKKHQRVIASIPDRDWQEESRRKRQRLAEHASNSADSQANGDAVGGSLPNYGLNIVDRSSQATETTNTTNNLRNDIEQLNGETPPQTEDEEALSALLGNRPRTRPTVIAPPSPPQSEDQAFQNSYTAAPRTCTLAEYEATPVDGYGAAILRGYLKSGQTLESRGFESENGGAGAPKDKPSWIPERRPGLLGLGAKESGLGVELGAWGKGAAIGGRRDRGSKPDDTLYNPLARRNKATGEVIAEDELKKKLDDQSRVVVDESRIRDKRDGDFDKSSGRSSDRHERRRRDEDDSESRGHRKNDRRRDYREDSDSERRSSKKEKNHHQRQTNDEDDRSGRHDKHRNRNYDSDRRNKHKGSSRDDRDADRHDRRKRSPERQKERDRHSSRR